MAAHLNFHDKNVPVQHSIKGNSIKGRRAMITEASLNKFVGPRYPFTLILVTHNTPGPNLQACLVCSCSVKRFVYSEKLLMK